MTMPQTAEIAPDLPLKERCILAAKDAIRQKGVESLSLRDVARRLGVSHQAPYKHYPTRDHLLAEVIRRCLDEFATSLRDSCDAACMSGTPHDAMQALGRAYLGFALGHPLEYRLMFSTPWPAAARDLGLGTDARAAFDILVERLGALKPEADLHTRNCDALFIWSTIHGLAGVLQGECMEYLSFPQEDIDRAVEHVMGRADSAILR